MMRELEEWEWDMVLAGDAPEELSKAAAEHPEYDTQLARFRSERSQLFQLLYRVECPDPLYLGELKLGLLGPHQQACVSDHLVHCLHCQEELVYLTETMSQPLFDRRGIGRPDGVSRVIMRFRKVLGEGGAMSPCAPALRGGGWTAYYEGNGYHLSLIRQGDSKGISLMGSIMLGEARGCVQLKRENRLLQSVPLTGDGAFLFTSVPAGQYDLLILMPNVDLVVEGIEIE